MQQIEDKLVISKMYMIQSAIISRFPFLIKDDFNIFLDKNRIHIICEKENIQFSLHYNKPIKDFVNEFEEEFNIE